MDESNLTIKGSSLSFTPSLSDIVFMGGGKEVLRITAAGELIISADATPRDAAEALHRAWVDITGGSVPIP